jgi:penicillin-binding protein 1B
MTIRKTDKTKPIKRSGFRFKWRWLALIIVLFFFLGHYIYGLDVEIREQFESKHQTSPVRVYARSLELYPGRRLTPDALIEELKTLGYRQANPVAEPGQYQQTQNDVLISTRAFNSWETTEPSRRVQVRFEGHQLKSINELQPNRPLALLRLQPQFIGQLYLTHKEERILLRLAEVPPLLIEAVHATIETSPSLQLVNNFYSNEEHTFKRQFDNTIMALLLKWHYSKEQIFEAYLNEVSLGYYHRAAIRGMGTAARFYFNRPLQELKLAELALLISLIRNASLYNPRRHPERALASRNEVLDKLTELGIITAPEAKLAKAAPLVMTKKPDSQFPYPAFIELVRHQLHQNYQKEDLRSEGLQVFTTLDPVIQKPGEKAMSEGLYKLENKSRKARQLQGAMVVTGSQDGEILALVNGKHPRRYRKFNRPINDKRTIGSLAQTVVYLTALEKSNTYNLTTQVDNSPFQRIQPNSGEIWKSRGYELDDRPSRVSLYRALTRSYILATVHLGTELGVSKLYDTLKRLGIKRDFKKRYPSIVLGGISLSPLEVAHMYQTIASGGFHIPLRAISAVSSAEGLIEPRHLLSAEQRFEAAPIFLLNYALQQAVREGIGHQVGKTLPSDRVVAGQTGSTNKLRNSWFAGFGSELLTVTWVGRDDNKPMGLTGSQGAMRIWADFIRAVRPASKAPEVPNNIEWRWVGKSRLPFNEK